MTRFFHPAGLVTAALLFVSQAHAAERTYVIEDFRKINVSEGIELTVRAGEVYRVEAEASRRSLLRRLNIEKRGDTLEISQDVGWSLFSFGRRNRYTVEVDLPELTELAAASGAEVDADLVAVDSLEVSASSGADVRLDGIDAKRLSLSASSGASIEADGSCGKVEMSASSGSDIEAADLTCADADLSASSGANIEVAVTDTLAGRVSSGGDVDVHGAPQVTQLDQSSGGAVSIDN